MRCWKHVLHEIGIESHKGKNKVLQLQRIEEKKVRNLYGDQKVDI